MDHLAFHLVRVQALATALGVVCDSYGAFHVFRYLNPDIMVGWVILAVGA